MKHIIQIVSLLIVISISNLYSAKDFITNPTSSDGFGAQFQRIIASMVYADIKGKKWRYTPFVQMEHNYDNDPHFLEKKEQFVNIIGNYKLRKKDSIPIQGIAYHAFFDSNIQQCSQSSALKKYKQVFRANKNIHNYFNNNNFNIAIHIRRPNQHDTRKEGADTPDTYFFKTIQMLRTLYASKNPLFHIYSQGSPEQFELFKSSDTILCLNGPVEDAFLSMVLADALVTSQSSLSYTAALLSDGIIYYTPFWHKPLPNWVKI